MNLRSSTAAVAALAFSLGSFAALPAAATAEDGAQAPGIARLSDLAGNVAVRRGDANQPVAAGLNAPVNVGDYVTTSANAHAEIEFDHASLLRVAPKTQVRFVKLDANQHELQLAEGTVEMRLFRGLDAHPLVDTPVATVIPDENGRYRVTVTQDGNTEVTVRAGKADVQIGDNNEQRVLTPGNTLLITGESAHPSTRSILTVAYDDFDKYADDRDGRWTDVANWDYTDKGMVGAADLNQYGQWSTNADYGQVWQPTNEPAGWSPYSDGRWVWEPYYGWTWVGYEPWGYAPYHYGRWFFADGGWFWYPGDAGVAYDYAPAEVGFFGWGDGVADLFDGLFANIGWTPLAPFESFTPWWGGGGTTVINNYYGGSGGYGGYGRGYGHSGSGGGYQNVNAPGGANGTTGSNFGSGNFEHIQPVGKGILNGIKPIVGTLPAVPGTGSLAQTGKTLLNGIEPLSPRFNALQPIKTALASFAEERTQAQTTLRAQASRIQSEPSLDAGRSQSDRTAFEGSPWSRFDSAGNGAARAETPSYARGETPAESVRTTDPWSRFGNGDRGTTARSDAPSYAVRDGVAAQMHGYSDQAMHGYSEPHYATPSYSSPSRGYAEPRYSAPSYSESHESAPRYSEPRYSEPHYSEPHYSEPHYSAPHYSAPHYSAPHYSAPRQSAPSRGSSNSGGDKRKR